MAEGLSLFGVWDYVVLALVLLISSAIGLYYRFTGGKQKTVQEYLLADKNMPITPVAFSLMASFMSAITILGVSSENYTFGIQFIVINFSYGLFTPVAAYLYLPVFFRLQATSAYEYLEKRFGKVARLAASLSYSLQMILYMGIVLYAPALTLEALTGISQVTAILSVGLVCTFYSTIGGMKAVLMTDLFQSLLMFAAVFSVIISALIETGGFSEIWKIAEMGNRTELLNFNPDPTVRHTWFSLIIGGGITFLSLYAVNQTQVQRYLTVKDLKQAQKALWLNWPILTALSLSTSFSGLAIYSKYYMCDPVSSGIIASTDQLMPYYVVDTMGHIPGLSGLFVAGIFSASLSTVSASVNSLAAVTLEDYLKPLYLSIKGVPLPEKGLTMRTKLIALVYGLVCIALAFLAQFLGGVLQAALTIFGVVGGPLLALFSLGMFTTTANQKGALTGLVVGLSLSMWIAFGGPKPPLPKLPVRTDGCSNNTLTSALFNQSSNISAATLSTLTTFGEPKPPLSILSVGTDDYSNDTLESLLFHQSSNFSADPLVQPPDESEYFWLYRLSYLYNGVVGLLSTYIVGYIVSFILLQMNYEKPKYLDPNLFIPSVAKRIRKQNKSLNSAELSQGTIKTIEKPEQYSIRL